MPCDEKRARKLLAAGRARVHRLYPFAIRLIDRHVEDCQFQPLELATDPGSKTTGLALVRIATENDQGERSIVVLNLLELIHRSMEISRNLASRASLRRGRRGRNTRYRAPRFDNRRRANGWLAPSLQHRVDGICNWVRRLRRLAPVTGLGQELVRFDTQLMQNPEISGVEYQRGELAGFEVREYVLAKWNYRCAYCDKKDAPLNLDHVQAQSKNGSNRVSNLAAACIPCNQKKGNRDVREFVKDPARLKRILTQLKTPLRDAAAVNSTRWALYQALKREGLPVSTSTGGRTKYNRVTHGIPKTHALDAACIGKVASVAGWRRPTLSIKASGRGAYQRTRINAYGFPIGRLIREKKVLGFQTGDMVVADVTTGKKVGRYFGRVAVRRTGSFNIQTKEDVVQGISHKYCKVVQTADGYGYQHVPAPSLTEEGQLPGFLPHPGAAASPKGSLCELARRRRGIHRNS